ncbi:MAG: glycosyltransferase [Erysipelotrichaceae bacterium]|jgi:glycosyltransferase involved in cell wall biosynthesis|nr:glycosyltransferase [Erysipelotrichaceae bacterium]
MNYKVSIITPAFNDERYISETIKSALGQTHTNFELIIIDDCSSDKTVDVIKSFNDERIVLIRNSENKGAAYSRNLGIKNASGDYIAFLDGDDLWKENKLEKQLSFMIENNYSFSASKYSLINEEGSPLYITYSAPKKMSHHTFLRFCPIGCLTAIYKREIYPDLSIPDSIKKRNDYALWIKLSERTNCYFLNENLAFYRKRRKSLSSGKKTSLLKYHIALFKKIYGFSKVKANFYALRNVFYYIIKNLFYKRKNKKGRE